MTHGSIKISNGEFFNFLHTTHDGMDAVSDVLQLPLRLFEDIVSIAKIKSRGGRGFYSITSLLQDDSRGIQKMQMKDLAGHWNSMIPLRTDMWTYTSYLIQAEYQKYFIMTPSNASKSMLDYWSYGFANVEVSLDDERLPNFTAVIAGEDIGDDLEMAYQEMDEICDHVEQPHFYQRTSNGFKFNLDAQIMHLVQKFLKEHGPIKVD